MSDRPTPAVVLAGQRSPSTPLCEAANVAADVLVPVAGRPALQRVLEALSQTESVRPRVVVGPDRRVLETNSELDGLFNAHAVTWREPLGDPATSSVSAVAELGVPVLITTGDHALLTPSMVDGFCVQAMDLDADLVVGLVPYALVQQAFPGNRRTVLRFAGDPCCGANLFLLKRERGVRALEFWRDLQQHRKRPQRLARELGVGLLLKYLIGRLSLAQALDALSARAGCHLGAVKIEDPTAAVDVDSVADWRLADQILSGA